MESFISCKLLTFRPDESETSFKIAADSDISIDWGDGTKQYFNKKDDCYRDGYYNIK